MAPAQADRGHGLRPGMGLRGHRWGAERHGEHEEQIENGAPRRQSCDEQWKISHDIRRVVWL